MVSLLPSLLIYTIQFNIAYQEGGEVESKTVENLF
jgi:hypothetical protein